MAEFTPSDRQLINRAADRYSLREIHEMLRFSRLTDVAEDIALWKEIERVYFVNHPDEKPHRQGKPATL